MVISQKVFGGLMPRVDPTLLEDSAATVAHNCRLRSGKLTPMKQGASFTGFKVRLENGITDMKDALTLFLWKRGVRKEFLSWPGHITVAPSNMFDDERHRIFVAGETGVRGTEISIPAAPVMSPDGMFMTSTFVQRFVGAPEYGTSYCSTQSAPHRYLDGLSEYKSCEFEAVSTPPDDSTHRVIYKVISVNGEVVTAVTQASWSQAIDGGSFPVFSIDFNRFLDGAEADFTMLTGDPLDIPPVKSIAQQSVTDPLPQDYVQYAFVQTYKDTFGRESPCSPLSNYVTYKDSEDPAWETVASAVASPPADAHTRVIYKVLGVYGDKLYVKTAADGSWEQGLTASAFPALTIALDSATEGEKLTRFFTNQFANQPCAYVSAIDSGGFDRHPICMDKLPKCTVDRVDGSPNGTLDMANARYTTFFQTWVDEYGYESPVSEGSDEVIYNDGDTMDVPVMTVIPAGAVKRRVYKVVTGTETESIQFIWEQDAVSDEFPAATFTVKDEDAGEILVNMTQCPKDLVWIVNMPGNFYAGFASGKKRQMCFSEIGLPTSWPDAYKYDIREDAVGLAVSGTTLFVLTVGQPYAISGTDPKAMTPSRISSNQGCVSKYSICTMNNAVFYASQDGVCMLSEGNQAENVITKGLFTRDQWLALNPSTCLMVAHDAALHMFFEKADGTRVAYMLDLVDGAPVLTTHDEIATAVFADVESDALYMIKEVSA